MAKRLNNLNEIVSTLRSGAAHYRKAARQSDDDTLEQTFLTHALTRETHAKSLADIIEDVGGEVREMHPVEKGWEMVSRLIAWGSERDKRLVWALEEHEDRTLAVFRRIMAHPDNQRDASMLQQMFGDFEHTHDVMRSFKLRMKRGAGPTETATKAAPHQPDAWKADTAPATDDAAQDTAPGEAPRAAA